MARFAATQPSGAAVLELEKLVRTAVFKSANQVVGYLLQKAADQINAAYQPKPGQQRKGREPISARCTFGSFPLRRDYYYHEGKKEGHYPADAALGLEGGHTPALARLACLEGADEASYQKAEEHLRETGGIVMGYHQIQRLVQRVGAAAQKWQQREALKPLPDSKPAPILYVSADATGVPMRKEELVGRAGKQPDGSAKTRSAYLGCVFTQHTRDEKGRPVRDYESSTYVSSMGPLEDFGPMLRQEAIRRNMGQAGRVVVLIDGAAGLENMGRLNFRDALPIVDFYHGADHGGKVVEALLGSKEHPEYQGPAQPLGPALARQRGRKPHKGNPPGMCRQTADPGGRGAVELLRSQRRTNAVQDLPPPRPLHRFGCNRGRLQDGHRFALQTIRHVLE